MSANNPLVKYWSFIEKAIASVFALAMFWAGVVILSQKVNHLSSDFDEISKQQRDHMRLLIEIQSDSRNRDKLIDEMRIEIKDLRKRLEDRKIVGSILDLGPIVGEAYKTKK